MTVTLNRLPSRAEVAKGDVLTVHHDRTWSQFKHLQKGYEKSNVRLSFYDGTVGILMPGRLHEIFKGLIGFLIELFLYNKRVDYVSVGSATQEKAGVASAEPDESYEIDGLMLSVEVNFTSGDSSKLARYKELGSHEVWIWEDGVLEVHHLKDGEYQKLERSLIPALAALDLQVMSACILLGETSRTAAADKLLEAHKDQISTEQT
ncbi:MAG: Uma2 family endonuclease [Cyanobacteria bacterium J06598_1]